ncbi:hypothetical protein [Desulforamulus aeronauticus]|uniref:Uncharacterized protein n=1 Tax=Desulforamulus aeronauticus DSM 10349 TaxID=1121421 RepID=A0A1M6PDA2_9FIRM|nr:hypothetical protein [Desulforamulus aeronauticus]SHK05894.1 hypothetical protein SAMN02745123_00512 [Desulforamulus aeronauticus DSM 10349]
MLVVFITKTKYKLLKGLRFALVFTILVILLVQLVGLVRSLGFSTEDKLPSGNPMRVMAPSNEICEDEMNHGILEKLIERLLKYRQGEK